MFILYLHENHDFTSFWNGKDWFNHESFAYDAKEFRLYSTDMNGQWRILDILEKSLVLLWK